jgi:uncharacterized membrane protein YcaP (DUF421 family)
MLGARFHFVSNLLKGRDRLLVKDGQILRKNMLREDISHGDLEEGLRVAGNVNSFEEVKEVRMERSGQISVVKK